MADTIEIEIVTPERQVQHDFATDIQIPGKSGYLGILPGHAPLITELGVGEISYRSTNNALHILAVAWGFAEVLPTKVTILAETAERAEDIDVERARKAKERAESRLKAATAETDFDRAEQALQRAETRLDVAQKGR